MTPEEFAESCLPSSNWPDAPVFMNVGAPTPPQPLDVWKSRRLAIAKMVAARDAEVRAAALEEAAKIVEKDNEWWFEMTHDRHAEWTKRIAASIRALAVKL